MKRRTVRGLSLVLLALAVFVAIIVAAGSAQAAVAPGTRDNADGSVTTAVDVTGNTAGVTASYIGNWENIGQNEVLLLGSIYFKNAEIDLSNAGDVIKQSDEEALTTNLSTFWKPLYIDMPDDFAGDVPADAAYTETNPDGSTTTYPGIEKSLGDASVTLRWKDAAILKDGTVCDLELALSDFVLRLNPGQTYYADDAVPFLTGLTNGNSLWADACLADRGGERQSGARNPGVGFEANVRVIPQDGATCASHGADQMIYYFRDLDVVDRVGPDGGSVQSRYQGKFAESIQLTSGIVGPTIIKDATYSDLDEASEPSSEGLYGNAETAPDGRLINMERLESSLGTWYSSSHVTQTTLNSDYSGFVTLVDPENFSFHWRGSGCGTALLAQAYFEPALRVVNDGRYFNVLTTTDLQTDPSYTRVDVPVAERMDWVARYNPTFMVADKGPTDSDPEGSSGLRSSITHRYYTAWKGEKSVQVDCKEGYHLTSFIISDGITAAASPEKNSVVIDVESIPVGEARDVGGAHAGMTVEKVSATSAIVHMNEPYTEIGGEKKSGFLTDHTLHVSAAPDVITVTKRWIGEEEPTSFRLEVRRADGIDGTAGVNEIYTYVTITPELAAAEPKIPGTDIPFVKDNGDGTWDINYPTSQMTGAPNNDGTQTWTTLPMVRPAEFNTSTREGAIENVGYRYYASESNVGEGWQLVGSGAGESQRMGYTNSNTWRMNSGSNTSVFKGNPNCVAFGVYGDDGFVGGTINNVEMTDFAITKEWDAQSSLTTDEKKQLLEDNLTLTASYEDVTSEYQLAFERDRLNGGTGIADIDMLPAVMTNTFITGDPDLSAAPAIDTSTWTATWEDMPAYRITLKSNEGTGALQDGSAPPRYSNLMPTIEKVEKITYSVTETQLDNFEAPEYDNAAAKDGSKAGETGAAYDGGKVVNDIKEPAGTGDETWGLKGQEQTGKPSFEKGTADIDKVRLVDPATGEPTDAKTVDALDENGDKVGTYALNDDGTVTFAPNDDYVGTPQPAKLQATDKNGLTATAEYQPHVIDDTETEDVSRTIHYIYSTDGSTASADVTQTATFTRKATGVDPDTHEPVWGDWELTENQIVDADSPQIDGWNPSSETVPGISDLTYDTRDQVKDVTVVYSPEPPEGFSKTSFGPKGAAQKGTVPFNEGTGEIKKYELIDDEGNAVDELPAYDADGNQVGTYTIDTATGEVTFTPTDPDFVGTPTPATVRAIDEYGETATGTYTPTCIENTEAATVTKTVTHVYEDGTPVLDESGNPLVDVQVLAFERVGEVDPDTGEVTWPAWEEQSFEDWTAPEVEGYSPHKDKSAGESVTPADGDITDQIVYKKDTYTVTYTNGSNGKSDGAGDETGVPYGDKVKGGNNVTPDAGYKFTGKYTYTITKKDGTVETGETDDPTSIAVTGDVEFTPVYEALPWVTYVDPATGRTIMAKTPMGEDGSEPAAPEDPARDGYTFAGWERAVDADGNVTYTATWKEVPEPEKTYWVTYIDPATGRVIKEKTSQPVGSPEPAAPADPTRDGYTFDGWDRTVDADGNVTYTARWKAAPGPKPTPSPTPAPRGKTSPGIPKTGDASAPWLVALLAIAGIAAVVVSRRARA